MAYTNEKRIENYLMANIDPSFVIAAGENQITEWIDVAELYINRYTGRKDGFEEDEVASVRYYDGNGKTEIEIDDCTTITSVEILEASGTDIAYTLTEGLDNDYIVHPYNELPTYRLVIIPNAQVGVWPSGKMRIKITAKWGYATDVPEDIRLAATMLVAGVIEKGLRGGKIRSETLGDYSVTYADMEESAQYMDVRGILDNYKIFKI